MLNYQRTDSRIKPFIVAGLAAVLLAACGDKATTTSGEGQSAYEVAGDHAIGNPDAKVTVVEYASVVCGACANFHNTVYSDFKQKYIDSGKVRFVFREFPTSPENLAQAGFLIANCADEDKFFENISLQFKRQRSILTSSNIREEYVNIAKAAGLSEAEFETCLANEDEIGEAIDAARGAGCNELVVLHCVSGYPTPAGEYNLKTLADIAKRFDVLAGLSDHTIDNVSAIAAVAQGACLIEKHVTMDRSGGGPDDSFSLEPDELAQLCRDARIAWQALGKVNYERTESEKGNAQFRRSLYVVDHIKKGETLTEKNVRSIRPGFGLAPKHLDEVLGKIAATDIEAGTALAWDMLA